MSQPLEAARWRSGLSLVELWIAYVALGGTGTPGELQATLAGGPAGGTHDQDVLAHALNERFADMGWTTRWLIRAIYVPES